MISCPSCGYQNPDGSRFCTSCGQAIHAEPPSTDTNTSESRKLGRFLGIGCFVVVGAVAAIIIIVVVVATLSGGGENEEDKRLGFHCLSAWDGHHPDFKDQVKARLKDPDSMEAIGTWISPVDQRGNHNITMEYRARNSFDGMVAARATGLVDNETCEAVVIQVE